jgi:5-hydroxyisourate hydrolase
VSLSTHVLDTSRGRPAVGVAVRLERDDGGWRTIESGHTDGDGRVAGWDTPGPGAYRLVFDVAGEFYPEVTVAFLVTDDSHYHVPLLISPYGYSTYRGS